MPAETILPPGESHTKCGFKTASHYSCITSIPLFVLTTCHPSSPNALRHPCQVDVVHRERCGPLDRLMPWWLTSCPERFRPGDVHFSQGHCHPSILHHIADGPMARMGLKGFNPTKQTKQIRLPPNLYHAVPLTTTRIDEELRRFRGCIRNGEIWKRAGKETRRQKGKKTAI